MFEEIVTEDGVKFNNLEKKIYKFVCMLGCMIIKYILESRDRKLMKARDKKKFRHKGYKQNCIKTIMGEIEYQRAVYEVKEDGETKHVYLLDEDMKIETIGKVSINLAEKALSIAVNTPSYRKGEEEIRNTTNETLSVDLHFNLYTYSQIKKVTNSSNLQINYLIFKIFTTTFSN